MSESTRSKIEKLEKKMSHIKARLASEKAKVRQIDKKRETRKKILAGAYLFEKYKGREHELIKEMDSFLTRDNDRVLFNLPMNREDS